MICASKKCGREIPEDAAFCPYCGRKLQKAQLKKSVSELDTAEVRQY